MTRKLYVIGDPVAHSLSPTIHTLWLEAAGIDARYTALQVAEGALAQTLDAVWHDGVIGANITLPHKEAALAASTASSDAARMIGAANTLSWRDSGGWHADNTDAPGLLAALAHAGEEVIAGRRIAILGAGGAARAAVFALHDAGADLSIVNRTVARAEELSEHLTAGTARALPLDALADVCAEADLVINTTSAGHDGSVLALPAGHNRLFLDISYGTPAAAQIEKAHAAGWRTEDGLAMLVAQAAESFLIWFGERPEIGPALRLCRAAVEART